MSAVSSSHKWSAAAITAAVLFTAAAARAQYSWSADFNNQLTPPGMMLRGNAQMQTNTGVSSTACVALTPAARGMQGDVILPQIWAADEMPAEVRVKFSLKLSGNSGGTQGDGFSVSVVSGIPGVLGDEEGFGPGPYYSFDTYENEPGDAGLDIKWPFHHHTGYENNALKFFPSRTSWYSVDIHSMLHSKQQVIRVNGDIIAGLQAAGNPPGIQYSDARVIFAARTGDAYNAHLIDNLSLDVTPWPIFRQQPASQRVTSGTSVLFGAQTNFNTLPWRGISTFTLVSTVTSEWQVRHPGGNWTAVPDTSLQLLWGPEARPFVTFNNLREDRGLWEGDDPAWSINGTEVRCVLNWHNGYAVATQPAVIHLMPLPEDFPVQNNPGNPWLQGCAATFWPPEEGIVMRLTPAQPDCSGGFIFTNLSHTQAGQPNLLDSVVATFQYRAPFATAPRADGISFNIASDLSNTQSPAAAEEGAGSGLRICFDAYSNGPEDPTAIDVIWKNQLIARLPFSADEIFGDDWITFYVRVSNAGMLDIALNGAAVLTNITLPNWTGIPMPKLGFYGRTGSFYQQQDVRALSIAAGLIAYAPFEPQLTIQRAAPNTLRLQWQVSVAEPWALFESADLVTWTRNTATPNVNGDQRELLYNTALPRRFFRMQRVEFTTP